MTRYLWLLIACLLTFNANSERQKNELLYGGGQGVSLAMLTEFRFLDNLKMDGNCQFDTAQAHTNSNYLLTQSGFKIANPDDPFAPTVFITVLAEESLRGLCVASINISIIYQVLNLAPFAEESQFGMHTLSVGQLSLKQLIVHTNFKQLQEQLSASVDQTTKELIIHLQQKEKN